MDKFLKICSYVFMLIAIVIGVGVAWGYFQYNSFTRLADNLKMPALVFALLSIVVGNAANEKKESAK
ncbi:MAG: hypothetical protein EOP04_22500 [Proteobacteria bacterium]|nr:MAG: hypothetical protein EOP04_22500 [Pseudomonadota bacterium]